MTTVVLPALFVPFGLAVVATYIVRRWALRVGFVDRPSGHKGHVQPVVYGGGIALFVAICGPILAGTLAVWMLDGPSPPDWLPPFVRTHMDGIVSKLPVVLAITGSACVLFIVGLIDDRRPLGAAPKFFVQIAVAVFIAWPMGIRVVEALPAGVSIAATVLWVVVITNAFNFLDNMDGLSAGVAAIAAGIFAVASMSVGQVFVPAMAWVLIGALLGFLVFNFSPASIFMGDAGSLVIRFPAERADNPNDVLRSGSEPATAGCGGPAGCACGAALRRDQRDRAPTTRGG